MLTKNFYHCLLGCMRRKDGGTYTVTVTTIDGNEQKTTQYMDDAPRTLLGALGNSTSIANGSKHGTISGTFFGTGRTPATVDDIALEAPITSTEIAMSSPSNTGVISRVDNDGAFISAAYNIANNSSEDVAVSEAGIYGVLEAATNKPFLLDHTVLETPIVIVPGQSVTINYEIRFPYIP